MKKKLIPLITSDKLISSSGINKALRLLMSPHGRLLILWVIRESQPITIEDIYVQVLGSNALLEQTNMKPDMLKSHLRTLESYGLITKNGAEYSTTPILQEITSDFHFSLTNAVYYETDPLSCYPVFGSPLEETSEWAQVFVLMPFTEALKPLYDNTIESVCQNLGVTCKRGDDFFSSGSIIQDVWSSIFYAEVCIADCTGRNPNVFYEIGIAHTLGRTCILISQTVDDIPFDIRHLRTIIYQPTPEGLIAFEEKLTKTLATELNLDIP